MSKEIKLRNWIEKKQNAGRKSVSLDELEKCLDIIYIDSADTLRRQCMFEIANHFGFEHQMMKLEEELIELLHATSRYNTREEHDYNDEELKKDLIEELGDVKMMITQIIMLLDIKSEINETIEGKILRTFERMPSPLDPETLDLEAIRRNNI